MSTVRHTCVRSCCDPRVFRVRHITGSRAQRIWQRGCLDRPPVSGPPDIATTSSGQTFPNSHSPNVIVPRTVARARRTAPLATSALAPLAMSRLPAISSPAKAKVAMTAAKSGKSTGGIVSAHARQVCLTRRPRTPAPRMRLFAAIPGVRRTHEQDRLRAGPLLPWPASIRHGFHKRWLGNSGCASKLDPLAAMPAHGMRHRDRPGDRSEPRVGAFSLAFHCNVYFSR